MQPGYKPKQPDARGLGRGERDNKGEIDEEAQAQEEGESHTSQNEVEASE